MIKNQFATQTKHFSSHFGPYGGRYVPETLMNALFELEKGFCEAVEDPRFLKRLKELREEYSGRPTPLTFAEGLTRKVGGARIYLKREDLNHTGAHKINNTLGQALLALRMGKKRLVAETGAGQHGVASATVAALLGMECVVFMGEEDVQRQKLNVFRMKLLGAEVVPVRSGTRTLKDATNEAIRHWVTHVEDTFYMLGSAVGPHPYPQMVRYFQRVIGDEARKQILEKESRLPDDVVACVGGGSNAIGMFAAFWKTGKSVCTVWKRRAKACPRGNTRRRCAREGPVCCTAPTVISCRTNTDRSSGPFDLRRIGLPRGGSRTFPSEGHGTGPVHGGDGRGSAGGGSPAVPDGGHFAGAGVGSRRRGSGEDRQSGRKGPDRSDLFVRPGR